MTDCFNHSCPFRVNESGSYNRCECIACPRRCVESFSITSNRTLTEKDLEELRRRNDDAAD